MKHIGVETLRGTALRTSFAIYAAAGLTSTAMAQDAAQIQDVQVTVGDPGERRKEEVLKTPRAIVVIDPVQAEREHLFCLDDFAQKLPSYRPNTVTPHGSRASIRGVGIASGGTGVGSQSATGFMIDNVFWIYPAFQWGDFVDLESVEVALGPQGAAFGKNTTVGNIILRTQLPSFTRKATIETSYGNYGRITEKVNVTGPIVDDKLAYRLSGYFDKSDGYFHDIVSGAGYLNFNRWGVRGQLLFTGDDVTDRFIASYGSSNEYNDYVTGPTGDSYLMYANGRVPAATFAQNFLKRLGRPAFLWRPYDAALTRQGTDPAYVYTFSNELNWQLGDNTFTAITAYGFAGNKQHGFSDGNNLVELKSTGMDTKVGQLSQEFRLASPKDQELEWRVGFYSVYEDAGNEMHHTDFGSDMAAWYGSSTYAKGIRNWSFTKSRDLQFAAYGNATYHIDEQWALTFGLRDSYEMRQGSVINWLDLVPGIDIGAQQLAILGAGSRGFGDTGGQRLPFRNSVTGIFNPQYKYDDNLLFYGLVGRGEKVAAVNTSANPVWSGLKFVAFPPVFNKPDVSWDYEIGVKTKWLDETLIANFNFYWNDLLNYQASQNEILHDQDGNPVSVSYLSNVPLLRLRGFEFDGRWKSPIEGLRFSYTGAFTDARYVSYDKASAPADWSWPASLNVGGVSAPSTLSRSNTRVEGIPMWTINAGFNYDRPLGVLFTSVSELANRSITGSVYANVTWSDKARLTDPHSVVQYWQPDFAIVNAGVGLRTDDEKYSLGFWVKNAFDARPASSFSVGSGTAAASIGLPSPSEVRAFGGTFRVKFD